MSNEILKSKSLRRKVRQIVDLGFTGLGIAVIFGAIMVSGDANLQTQVLMAVVGVLLVEAGVWNIAGKFMPSERRYGRLRDEGDHMIDLVRQLHGAAVARDQGQEDSTRFKATLEEMHATVRLMAYLASLEDGQELDQKLKDQLDSSSTSDQCQQSAAQVSTKVA